MSRFIDKLKHLSRTEPLPMGFKKVPAALAKPKIQLVASLTPENVDYRATWMVAADAGLLRVSNPTSDFPALQKLSQALPDISWGGWLSGSGLGEMDSLTEAGGDFMVFPAANTPLAILQDDELGKILEVTVTLDEGLLRAINELPIDAVLIAGEEKEGYFLTWQHLIFFRRFTGLLVKPLLVSIPSSVKAGELQALWMVGVKGVVVGVGDGSSQDRLKELRQVIDKLDFPLLRQRVKAEPLLPLVGREPSTAVVEEEEEE